MKKAIIIGSGIAGLATSIRLALKGYKTNVFEIAHPLHTDWLSKSIEIPVET